MYSFILTQYKLYQASRKSIGIEKIKKLAELYLPEKKQRELFDEVV